MKRRVLFVVSVTVLCAAVGVGFWARGAFAEGIPTDPAMYYSGQLLENDAPAAGPTRFIEVSLWTNSNSTDVANRRCVTTSRNTIIEGGRFRIPLDSQCDTAVRNNPNLFVQVQVDETTPTILPRTRLGAVPYAIEAERATRSNVASRLSLRSGSDSISDGLFVASTTNGFRGRIEFGGLVGYQAAKAACVAAVGSPTAHLCTAPELSRSAQLGLLTGNGRAWYTSGVRSNDTGGYDSADCVGWTYAGGSGTVFGPVWNLGSGSPDFSGCLATERLLCCD